MYTKHGPQVHGPLLWTRRMDPVVDSIHGLPLWTTPHFVKLQAEKSLDKRGKWSSQLSGQFKQLSLIIDTWKFQATLTGFKPITSAMLGQCSTNWASKPLSWAHVNLLGSFVLVKDSMVVLQSGTGMRGQGKWGRGYSRTWGLGEVGT